MSEAIADSTTHRLIPVPPGGPLRGHSVGVSAGATPDGEPDLACLMTIQSAQGVIRTGVHGVAAREVPPNVIAVGDDLAAEWDADLDRLPWTLERADPVAVRSLTLELAVEQDLAAAARDIARAGLVGELLWIPADGSEMSLTVDELPYRVHSIDAAGRTGVLGLIARDTRVEVYAPAVRAGVDLVILADCSGSMAVDDLPAGAGNRSRPDQGERWLTRMQALKQSLGDLLAVRLQTSGRVSRLALMQFNHATKQLFPRAGGMAQLDGSSPARDIAEFRESVESLRPSGHTDIGGALYEAANLLCQYGHAANEKLIVLVSDGADWTPKGEEGSGEMVEAVSEPVSLMTHLHQDVGIRLHALGVSTDELYRRRGYKRAEGMVPDHELLRELVKAGGGDPTAVGGIEVLEAYFSGLGTGVSHRVREPLQERRAQGPMPAETIAVLARLTRDAAHGNWTARCAELSLQIMGHAGECREHALRTLGGPIWDDIRVDALCERAVPRPVVSEQDLARVLEQMIHALRPRSTDENLAAAARALCQTLDRLAAIAEQKATVGATYRRYFWIGEDAVAALQADAMKRVCDGLAALRENLSRLPDHAGRADPLPLPSDAAAAAVYRD